MIRLCSASELTAGSARGFAVAGTLVLLVRPAHSEIKAYLNRCPHLGVALNWEADQFMDNEGNLLRCATHGALFEPDSGLCVQGPCRGQSLWPLDCLEQEGDIYLDTSELPPAANPDN